MTNNDRSCFLFSRESFYLPFTGRGAGAAMLLALGLSAVGCSPTTETQLPGSQPGTNDAGIGGTSSVAEAGAGGGTGGAGGIVTVPPPMPDPVIFISIDGLHPAYLQLDERGNEQGSDGNWLMPNVRQFIDAGTVFANARSHLPAATDMNHLNVIAGTHTGQTGIYGISVQLYGWESDNKPQLEAPHLAWARDGSGQRVETLFQLWAQQWPESKSAFISGKGWVADMYRQSDQWNFDPGIDVVVSGGKEPDYAPKAEQYERSFYDPPTDVDADCDPESLVQKQYCKQVYEKDPDARKHFPPDSWTVDASLAVFENDHPNIALILLAQTDDAQHALGAAWDPDEFVKRKLPYIPPIGCIADHDPDWQLVSKRNSYVYKAPILDAIRDVDVQFKRLVDGIRALDGYANATIVVYSDHALITHWLPATLKPEDGSGNSTNPAQVLYEAGVISKAENEDWDGFCSLSGSSMGGLFWHPQAPDRAARIALAKQVLLEHRVVNPVTGVEERPWEVADQQEMMAGIPGRLEPGEMWHDYYGPTMDDLPWPDLMIEALNGWQVPVYQGMVGNLGLELPEFVPPFSAFIGGHGATDTLPIVMAVQGPNVAQGKVLNDADYQHNYRISDLAVTVATMVGLTFPHSTVGVDRTAEILLQP